MSPERRGSLSRDDAGKKRPPLVEHYHVERNHQGLGNVIPFPSRASAQFEGLPAPEAWRSAQFLREKGRVNARFEIWDSTGNRASQHGELMSEQGDLGEQRSRATSPRQARAASTGL